MHHHHNDDSQAKARRIAQQQMYEKDAFSQWLGIEIVELDAGKAVLTLSIRPDMTNGFQIAHGGIAYSLADSALAFAANAHGRKSLSVETSISHTLPIHLHDLITATATEESLTNKIGVYRVLLTNQHQQTVAVFKGVVYRTAQTWE